MSEYIWCPECETTFPEDDIEYVQTAAETRDSPAEYISRCPNCGAVEPCFENAYYCEHCENYYHSYKMSEIERMCQGCFDSSVRKLKKFVESHGNKTDDAVLSFLLDF